MMLVAAASLAILGLLFLAQPGQTPLGIQLSDAALLLAALILLVVGLQFTIGPWIVYRGSPALKAAQTWEFRGEGVVVNAVIGSSQLNWSAYRRARLDREFLFLHLRSGFQIIPLRAVGGPVDVAALESLIKRYLPLKGHP